MQTALSAAPTRVRCIGNVTAPNAAGQVSSTRLPRHRAPRFASIVAQDKGFSSGPLDEGADAYNEAYDLYQQANKVSQLQTRYEMETAWTSESPPPRGGAASAPSESAVIALLQEHGLSTREASSLFKDLYSKVSSSSNPSPAPQAAPHPQRQSRLISSKPLDIIPKEVTGVPRRQRPSQSAGNPHSGRSAAAPPSRPPQAANRAPAARQEDDWDWGASGGLHNGSTGVNSSTSSIGSAAGRAQAQGGWSAASDRSLGGCGSLPAGTYGQATGPSPFQQGCGETVTPIPYDSASDPYCTSGLVGQQSARPGSSSSNMDERSLGGCGTLPAGAFGKASVPSPFQQGCGETVTPIPYDATSDPYYASGFSSQQPRARPNSNSHGSPSPASTQSRNAPKPTAAQGHSAVTEPGRSLGGCGDVPVWNEDLFNDPPATLPNSTRNSRSTPPTPTRGQSAATDPGHSLGGCGDVPVWNEALFNEAVFDAAPPNSPFTQAAAKGRSAEVTASSNKRSSTDQAPEVPATANPYRTNGKNESPMTLSQLSARLDRWQRVLPGVNPARLAAVDSGFLTADVGEGLKAMITLVTEMPGRDVMGMLDRVPRLLWADNLRDRVRRCVTTLTRLHPSRDAEVVKDMIAEYPELVFRMDYYTQARLLDELPIEIQNMMIVADQGIGYTYRYYRNRKTDYQAEITSDEPFEQQT